MHRSRIVAATVGLSVALALALSAGLAAAQSAAPDDLAQLRQQALAAVNKSRAQHGMPPLKLGAMLDIVAQNHADDMFEHRYYAHTSPQGVTVQDRYLKAGGSKWELIAENIARCEGCRPPASKATVARLQEGWMNSPEHRANILHRGLTRFGYGIVLDRKQGLYAVQTFAGPGVPRGLKSDETARAISSEQQSDDVLARINATRKKTGAKPLRRSPALTDAAQSVLPKHGLDNFDMTGHRSIYDTLPRGTGRHFRSIATLEAACGGCGVAPSAADVRYFASQWMDDAKYKQMLTDKRFTDLGFALAANGEGKKVAILLLGAKR